MTNKYENVVEEFNKRNCKLLNTNEEYIEILKSLKNTTYKLNYIASCGHEHIVFYNVFKSRGTGIICPSCKIKKQELIKRQKYKTMKYQKYILMNKKAHLQKIYVKWYVMILK
jgi:hypothetical protein